MTHPRRPDRPGFPAALILCGLCLVEMAMAGPEVTDERPKMWLGHWIALIWSFIGWLPVLLLARGEPQPPEARP